MSRRRRPNRRRRRSPAWELGRKLVAALGARRRLLASLAAAAVAAPVLAQAASWAARSLLEAPQFAMRQVAVQGIGRVADEDVVALTGLPLGRPLWNIDTAAVAQAVRQHPWVRDVRVTRRLPDRLVVAVSEHQPALWVALGRLWLADVDGQLFKPFQPGDEMDLPVLTGVGSPQTRPGGPAVADRVRLAHALATASAAFREVLGSPEEVHWDADLGWSLILTRPSPHGGITVVHVGDTGTAGLARAATAAQLIAGRRRVAATIWADGSQHQSRVQVQLEPTGML